MSSKRRSLFENCCKSYPPLITFNFTLFLCEVVIKLEGGTDFDLTVLDQPEPEDPGTRSRNNSETVTLDQRLAQ